jgi:hypothetical protein
LILQWFCLALADLVDIVDPDMLLENIRSRKVFSTALLRTSVRPLASM